MKSLMYYLCKSKPTKFCQDIYTFNLAFNTKACEIIKHKETPKNYTFSVKPSPDHPYKKIEKCI